MFALLQKRKNQKGFTLIELLVVIGIIGVLVGIAIPQFSSAQATAKGTKIAADLRTIDSAIMQASAAGIATPTGGADGNLVPTYIAVWPTPPQTGPITYPIKGTATAPTTQAGTLATAYAVTQPVAGGPWRATIGGLTVENLP